MLAWLPEKSGPCVPPWVVPLNMQRIPTKEKSKNIAVQQIKTLITDDSMFFKNELTVAVVDSGYGSVKFLGHIVKYDNLVVIARVDGNRVFFKIPGQDKPKEKRGHPKWFGDRFDLHEQDTWGQPSEVASTILTTKKGRILFLQIESWCNLLMHGKDGLPMHRSPFTLIRVITTDKDGKRVFHRPMWLIVIGKRRGEITLLDATDAYRQRFDLEHFFRFGKNHLLLTGFQTPDVEHEENWWELVGLSYVQLWLAKPLTNIILRPWEMYAPPSKTPILASPSKVKRDYKRIIGHVGTPAVFPKRRGNSGGRVAGTSPGRRERYPVIKKGGKDNSRAPP